MSRRPALSCGLALALFAACSSAPPPPPAPVAPPPAPVATAAPARDESFRKAPPPAGPDVVFVPPKIEETRLANGLRILVVERHELPIVAVQIAVTGGADQGGPGVGAFATAMLASGTKTRGALQLSDEMSRLGAVWGASADFDGAFVRMQCLAPKLSPALLVLADVVLRPAFDKAELERERARRLTAIAQQNDSPATLLSNAVAAALYPEEHRYASPLIGTEPSVGKLVRDDLVRFHDAHFRPDRTTVAIAGDITKDEARAEIERVLGGWKGKGKKALVPALPPPPKEGEVRVIVIDRPKATQSNVALALPGVPRATKDFDAILVMNTILGGQFSSRLNLNLREKHAYTYGARSGFDMRRGPGPFTAGGAMFADKTGAAVKEIIAEVDRIRSGLVTDEELADAKTNLVRQLPARFETAGETAATLAGLAVYGLPLDEYATRPARVQRVTREDVKRVAETYFSPSSMRIVVVGDAALVKADLATLGLGPVDVRSPPKAKGEAKK